MTNVRFARRAKLEVARIDAWWREHRPSSPDLFLDELAIAVRALEVTDVGRPFSSRAYVRRLVLPRTRYHVYYEHLPGAETLDVLSVWSARRGRGPKLV